MPEGKENYSDEKVYDDDLNQISKNANDGAAVRDSLLMGESFTGSATPQAAYLHSDGKLYVCDGNDSSKLEFLGFVLNSGSEDDAANFQGKGVVRGFSGLTPGAKYYIQDDKTLGVNPGTYEVLVGKALSATELLILKDDQRKGLVAYVASDNLKISADTERSMVGASYTKVKEVMVKRFGTIRVKFDLKCDVTDDSFGRIYVNGVAVGTERNNTTSSYVTYSEDITVKAGDLVQLYYKQDASGNSVYTRNFRIYYDRKYDADYIVNLN